MNNFDFSTLNSADLEELAADLLNAQARRDNEPTHFKTFKDGKDKGIDLLYEGKETYIGQVKHYYRTGYDQMYRDLKNKELQKVIDLAPDRYLFITSVDLSVDKTEELYALFTPYIKSKQDIYGKKDLNRLIGEFPDVLETHFKLWFSSTAVLQKLLNYKAVGRSGEFIEHKLKQNLRLYVKTIHLDTALQMLSANNYVVITGEPGVGKTALAELLTYEFIKADYELTYISGDITEIEGRIKPDDEANQVYPKQVFYYDDFLGHTEKEIDKAKASEAFLRDILWRIRNGKYKKLILTTRSFILNAALEESERLRRTGLQTHQNVVGLKAYSPGIRQQLVRNHVEESEIADELKAVVLEPTTLDFITEHQNFYPRSVQFITATEQVGDRDPKAYREYIIQNFNKPDEIWRHAYTYQIQHIDRLLLNTMISFGYGTHIEKLQTAFDYRIDEEVGYHNFIRPVNAFRPAIQRMMGGFLISDTPWDPALENTIRFINPSLVDFLVRYLQEDPPEAKKILTAAIYTDQLSERFFDKVPTNHQLLIPERLKQRLLADHRDFQWICPDLDFLTAGLVLYRFGGDQACISKGFEYVEQITAWDSFNPPDRAANWLEDLLLESTDPLFIEEIKRIGAGVFFRYIEWTFDYQDFKEKLSLMLNKYGFSFSALMELPSHMAWSGYFTEMLANMVGTVITQLSGEPFDEDRVEEARRTLIAQRNDMRRYGVNPILDLQPLNEYESSRRRH